MTSFSDFLKQPDLLTDQHSLLLIGVPGSGKSTIAALLPNAVIIDLDRNIRGPFELIARNNLPCSASVLSPYFYKDNTRVPPPDVWRNMCDQINEAAAQADEENKTITFVFDSCSALNQVLIDMVRGADKQVFGTFGLDSIAKMDGRSTMKLDSTFEYKHWGAVHAGYKRLIDSVKATRHRTVFTCHITTDTELKKPVINVASKFRLEMPGLFTGCWLCEKSITMKNAKPVSRYIVRTSPGPGETYLGLKPGKDLPAEFEVDLKTIASMAV